MVFMVAATNAFAVTVALILLRPDITNVARLIIISLVFCGDLYRLKLQLCADGVYEPIDSLIGVVTRTQITLVAATTGLVLFLIYNAMYLQAVSALMIYIIVVALTLLLKHFFVISKRILE